MSSGSKQDAEARITHVCVEEGDQCEFRWRGCLWNEICEVYLVLRGTLGGKHIVVVPRKCDRTRAPFSATWRVAAALASTRKATTAKVSEGDNDGRRTVAVGAAVRDAAAGKSAGVWATRCGAAQTCSHCAAFTATGRFAAALATGPVTQCVAGVATFTMLAVFLFSVSAYFLICFVNQLLLSDCEI